MLAKNGPGANVHIYRSSKRYVYDLLAQFLCLQPHHFLLFRSLPNTVFCLGQNYHYKLSEHRHCMADQYRCTLPFLYSLKIGFSELQGFHLQ